MLELVVLELVVLELVVLELVILELVELVLSAEDWPQLTNCLQPVSLVLQLEQDLITPPTMH